ncbi:MAG: M23 family metallopeptidase, partial [Bacillota bacterium]|nr:M23 family metallopeptidase [Bacillota bacterium]
DFVMPVNGEIQRGQGYDYDPSTEDYRFHRGLDLAAEPGEPVFCLAAGKVTAAAKDAYWGGIVVVDHGGGWSSAYRGLEPAVEAGDSLEAGAVLGRVLPSVPAEAAQTPHLHLELSLEGTSLDPTAWL